MLQKTKVAEPWAGSATQKSNFEYVDNNNLGKTCQRVSFTLWTKYGGDLTKTISLSNDRRLIKDSSQCQMSSGQGRVIQCGFNSFGDVLTKANSRQAISHGVPVDTALVSPFEVISEKKLNGSKIKNTISRTQENIGYSEATNSIFMIDYDPAPGFTTLSHKDLIIEIDKILPGFKKAAKWVNCSTSSCISDNKGEITGQGAGCHIYFTMPPGTDVKRFKEIFKARAWIAGHGFIKISKSGAMLERNRLFDEYVFSPERLDFVAGAVLSERLTQSRPTPSYFSGGVFDPATLPDLTIDEIKRYKTILAEAKRASKAEAQTKRDQYIETRAAELFAEAPSVPLEKHKATIKAACGTGDLYGDFIIYPDGLAPVTVSEILKNPEKYNCVSCADPIEPGAKGKAKIYVNVKQGKEKPVIRSYHHGDHLLFLHGSKPPWSVDKAEAAIIGAKDQSSSKRIDLVKDILENNNFESLSMDIIRDSIKSHLKINKKAQNSFLHSTKPTEDADTRTHIELATDFIKDRYPDRAKAVSCEGCIWTYSDSTGLFEKQELDELEPDVGTKYKTSSYCKRKSDYRSIVSLVSCSIRDNNFFKEAVYGLPGENSFYRVQDGKIKSEPYTPELRQRFKLSCDPDVTQHTPKFDKYLKDTFRGDLKQIALLQSIMGALVTGTARKLQKAFLLYGSGMNGKSVILDICNGMFPKDLKCSVKPDELSNEYYKAQLAGKVINIVGELDKTDPIKADFKDVVSCDTPVTARLPYKEPFTFTPGCGHIFACNGFPRTRDHSYGFYRRWEILHFKYKVDIKKRIPELGKIILREELPGVLAWCLRGAETLIANDFTLPYSAEHDSLLAQWQNMQDSVRAFFNDPDWVIHEQEANCIKEKAYKHYREYCYQSNVKAVGLQHFYSRVRETYKDYKPPYGKRRFLGFRVQEREI